MDSERKMYFRNLAVATAIAAIVVFALGDSNRGWFLLAIAGLEMYAGKE